MSYHQGQKKATGHNLWYGFKSPTHGAALTCISYRPRGLLSLRLQRRGCEQTWNFQKRRRHEGPRRERQVLGSRIPGTAYTFRAYEGPAACGHQYADAGQLSTPRPSTVKKKPTSLPMSKRQGGESHGPSVRAPYAEIPGTRMVDPREIGHTNKGQCFQPKNQIRDHHGPHHGAVQICLFTSSFYLLIHLSIHTCMQACMHAYVHIYAYVHTHMSSIGHQIQSWASLPDAPVRQHQKADAAAEDEEVLLNQLSLSLVSYCGYIGNLPNIPNQTEETRLRDN